MLHFDESVLFSEDVSAFWDVTTYNLIKYHGRFGETFCPILRACSLITADNFTRYLNIEEHRRNWICIYCVVLLLHTYFIYVHKTLGVYSDGDLCCVSLYSDTV